MSLRQTIGHWLLGAAPAAPAPLRQRGSQRPPPPTRGPYTVPGTGAARAGLDAAASNRYNDSHFADADNRWIGDILTADLDKTRQRCKYEHRNNALARGIVSSWANFVVGAYPQVQFLTTDPAWNEAAAAAFTEWAVVPRAIDAGGRLTLGGHLRLALRNLAFNGDGLWCQTTAAAPARRQVSLRVKAVDPIRLASPYALQATDYRDGIKVDRNGLPLAYRILRQHPYDTRAPYTDLTAADDWAADKVHHFFIQEEADQYRGFPLLAPAVTLLADLRRYTKAVLGAAEAAANVAGLMHSEGDGTNTEDIEAMDEFGIPRNSVLTLPRGWEFSQLKAEQPSGTYSEFRREIIGEIARCLSEPFIIAYGSSQDSSYASGRLDWQDFMKSVGIIQTDFLEPIGCDPLADAWLLEAQLIGVIPAPPKGTPATVPRQWFWSTLAHVDPNKEAEAQNKKLANLTSHLEIEWAKQGLNWRDQLAKIAAINAEMSRLNTEFKLPTAYQLTPLRPNNVAAQPAPAETATSSTSAAKE